MVEEYSKLEGDGYGVWDFGEDGKNVLKLIKVMDIQLCKYAKKPLKCIS